MAAYPGVGDTFGRYEIVRRIGRGGMGTVFEARQVGLGSAVALKVLSPELADDPDFRARFAREARMLAKLDSPHVIRVLDSGEQDGEVYLATQLVQGRDLLQLLRESGPLSPAAALRVVGQVATALADAHDAGVLHRDVKPSNVLIRESRADYFAYLCDFGIARHADSSHTRTGGVLGTLAYMAPECHDGADASVSSDLYSLGCVLWAALTGRAPFERTSEYQVAVAHLQEEIPTYIGDSAAAFRINEILRRSMAKEPRDRFDSAGAMHVALMEAEETARGLHRDSQVVTGLRTEPDPDRTQLRVARPDRGARSTTAGPGSAPRGRSGRVLAVCAVALVALLALGGTAVALLSSNDPEGASGRSGTASPSVSPEQPRSTSPKPRRAPAKVPAQAEAETPTVAPSSAGPGTEQPTAPAQVGCWEGSSAATPMDCPTPYGRRGLETVFPSLDGACVPTSAQGVAGKAEVFECNYGGYLIRYSRWVAGADRHGYLDRANPGASRPVWLVDGEFYGRAWVSYEDSSNEDKKYQWSATYRGNPYSVSVEAVDAGARDMGMRRVVATPPGQIGLP